MFLDYPEKRLENKTCPICSNKRHNLIQAAGEYSIVRCIYCGVLYVNPLPPKEKHIEFHNQEYFYKYYGCSINDFYETNSSSFRKEMQLKTARLDYVSRFSKLGKILDIGTGQGLFLVLAKDKGWDVFGTDISSYVCEFLSKHKNIKMFNGYLEDVKLPYNFFDVVTMWHVLEHVYDPYKTFLEIIKILKVGGHLFIAVPNTFIIEMYLRKLFNKPHFREDISEWHFYYFTPKSLKYLVNRLGFKIESIDSEFYLKRNKVDQVFNYVAQIFLRYFRLNICKTILIHAIKTANKIY